MQFINKFKYKRKGHRIIKAFIKDKWNNDIQRYVNSLTYGWISQE